MLAPQSGQTRLRMAEIKLELLFVTTESEAIRSLPAVAVLHRRMHRTVSGAAGAFRGGVPWIGLRPLASDVKCESTSVAKCSSTSSRKKDQMEIRVQRKKGVRALRLARRSSTRDYKCVPGRFASVFFTGPCKPGKATGRKGNLDANASATRETLSCCQASRRGELPGSGVTSSTAHRAGPSALDPAGTFLPNRPLAAGTVLSWQRVYLSLR